MNIPKASPIARRPPEGRSGFSLITFALLLVALLGMVGLVIDGGLLLAAYRHAGNAADSAALAAAMDKYLGKPDGEAIATATTFVQEHNGLGEASVQVNIPPATGAYAGNSRYVEALVTYPLQTLFIHWVGLAPDRTVQGRAVAGMDRVNAGDDVMALDPDAYPGLFVNGEGILRVPGKIQVNSEGGGLDENGDPINNGNPQTAARGGPPNSESTGTFAELVSVVGGVNKPEAFHNIDGSSDNPLQTQQLPEPDPYAALPTPTVANGVDPTFRGSVSVSSDGNTFTDPDITVDADGTVNLPPGIYESIQISSGVAQLQSGIFVIAGGELRNSGGELYGDGVMFYMTGADYDPITGLPDADAPYDPMGQFPPPSSGSNFDITINSKSVLNGINTNLYAYENPAIEVFNGMLFYKSRLNTRKSHIEGNSGESYFGGTFYSKWSELEIAGQGRYDGQFVVGSLKVAGTADFVVENAGGTRPMVDRVFLVE